MEGIIIDFFTLSYDDKILRVLELKRGKQVTFGSTELGSGIVSNGKIMRKEIFAESLSLLLSKTKPHKITSKNAVLYIPESKVFLKILEIPKINLDKIPQAITWQAENILPVSPENVYFDWQKIAETQDQKIKLLVTACAKEAIDPLLESLSDHGFNVLSIKSKAGALAGLFASTPHKPIMIVNIEPEETSLTIAKNNVARVSTSLPTLKDYSALLEKISQTIGFYQERKGEKEIKSIIILGSTDNQFKEKVSALTKIPAKFGNYYSNNFHILGQEKKDYLINLALAHNPYLGVNLLPEPYKKNLLIEQTDKKLKSIGNLMIVVSLLLILAMFIFWWILSFDLYKSNAILSSAKLAKISPNAQVIETEIIDLNKRITRIELLSNQRSRYWQVMEKISQIYQMGVTIKSFSLENEGSKFKITGNAQTREQFLQFKEKLYEKGLFKNISVPLKSLERPQDINFELSFNYNW